MTSEDYGLTRRMWHQLEPVHAVFWYAARPASPRRPPWPDEPHLVLWHAIAILREHRGDGHITALMTAGLDPCEALVSFAAIGAAPAPRP
jgi:hypothetical protein